MHCIIKQCLKHTFRYCMLEISSSYPYTLEYHRHFASLLPHFLSHMKDQNHLSKNCRQKEILYFQSTVTTFPLDIQPANMLKQICHSDDKWNSHVTDRTLNNLTESCWKQWVGINCNWMKKCNRLGLLMLVRTTEVATFES